MELMRLLFCICIGYIYLVCSKNAWTKTPTSSCFFLPRGETYGKHGQTITCELSLFTNEIHSLSHDIVYLFYALKYIQ